MSEILVNTIKKADGTGGLTVPSGSGTVATLAGGTFTGDITMSSADLVVGSNSIFIGGTGSANELSDYEEGTWSVTLTPGTSGSYNSYSTRLANYTKIGNVVSVRVLVTVADGGASSPVGTTVQLSLPFTSSSYGAASFFSLSSNSTSRNVHINGSQSYATLYIDASTIVWGGAGNDVSFEATYRTDS